MSKLTIKSSLPGISRSKLRQGTPLMLDGLMKKEHLR